MAPLARILSAEVPESEVIKYLLRIVETVRWFDAGHHHSTSGSFAKCRSSGLTAIGSWEAARCFIVYMQSRSAAWQAPRFAYSGS